MFYIDMIDPESGSRLYKTTRHKERAAAFIKSHELLGWTLKSLTHTP